VISDKWLELSYIEDTKTLKYSSSLIEYYDKAKLINKFVDKSQFGIEINGMNFIINKT